MISEYEAAKLQCDMRHELDGTAAAVAKSAAGLAILTLVALFGAGTVGDRAPSGIAASRQATAEHAMRADD
ncbi:MAG TPA: hypothetical protein VED01_15500 [Burkholderiales bacterium]|nr:hypothetical protein [Burkholderiales bacterium]